MTPRPSSFSGYLPSLKSTIDILSALLFLVIFTRASVLTFLFPALSSYFYFGTYIVLFMICIFLISRGDKKIIVFSGILVVLAVAASCFFSPLRGQSLKKGIGWLILFITLGPVIAGPSFYRFRESAWICCRSFILFVGVSSAFWYILHLPHYGAGDFSGVMNHCMLTGPLAAMACLFAILQAVHRKSYWWALVGLLCIAPILAAGSRTAILSLIAGTLVNIYYIKRLRITVLLLFPLIILFLMTGSERDINVDDHTALGEMTSALRNKGTNNTRSELWDARMSEFNTYPFLGMGVGIGDGAGVEKDAGQINIEPGSSYLAVLSMTGSIGALAFVILILVVMKRFLRHQNNIPLIDKVELISILMFLAVHAIAEGWILAVGSLIAVIFWLAMGRLLDISTAAWNSKAG